MAYNFLGLVNNVCEQLNEVPLTETNFASATGAYAQIKSAVNAALNDINQMAFEWPFNHVIEELILTPDQTRYTYPAGVKTIKWDSFRLKRDNALNIQTRFLLPMDYEEYLANYVDAEYDASNQHGIPRAVFRTPSLAFGFYPPPDEAYTVVYEYYALPDELELATDVPYIPVQFRFVILDAALYYAFMFRGDPESASAIADKKKTSIGQMRTIYQNRYEYVRSSAITG